MYPVTRDMLTRPQTRATRRAYCSVHIAPFIPDTLTRQSIQVRRVDTRHAVAPERVPSLLICENQKNVMTTISQFHPLRRIRVQCLRLIPGHLQSGLAGSKLAVPAPSMSSRTNTLSTNAFRVCHEQAHKQSRTAKPDGSAHKQPVWAERTQYMPPADA